MLNFTKTLKKPEHPHSKRAVPTSAFIHLTDEFIDLNMPAHTDDVTPPPAVLSTHGLVCDCGLCCDLMRNLSKLVSCRSADVFCFTQEIGFYFVQSAPPNSLLSAKIKVDYPHPHPTKFEPLSSPWTLNCICVCLRGFGVDSWPRAERADLCAVCAERRCYDKSGSRRVQALRRRRACWPGWEQKGEGM